MPFEIIRNDITKMKVDAIVNAANKSLLGGGGVDGCIHRAAGPELLAECKLLNGCEIGSAKITKGYQLPCMYVINAVGPRWIDGNHHEKELLESCYTTSLHLAKDYGCKSIAFPLISSGIYGYSKAQALRVAVEQIRKFLLDLVIFDRKSYEIGDKLYSDIESYIDDQYVDEYSDSLSLQKPRFVGFDNTCLREGSAPLSSAEQKSIMDWLSDIDESFSEMLLRKIDESGMSDAECYKKANIDRKLFSKIRSDKLYKPSKPTVIAFALALELSIEEMQDMLAKAGFALSHSSKFDLIIEYFVKQGNYNVHEINAVLFAFDQSLIGG